MYWLPKLHKKPYKERFIANTSSCTTTELPKLLTSCLTAVKNHVIRYCEKVYEGSGKKLFWSIKNSGEVLNKLKSRGFRATSLSTYDFSTLYTTNTSATEWTIMRKGNAHALAAICNYIILTKSKPRLIQLKIFLMLFNYHFIIYLYIL